MKIIGGSFGLDGTAKIKGQNFYINGIKKVFYGHYEIESATTDTNKEKKFGALSFVLGTAIMGTLLFLIFGVLGFVIGIILAIAGSFYSVKAYTATLIFKDKKEIRVSCSRREAKAIIELAN